MSYSNFLAFNTLYSEIVSSHQKILYNHLAWQKKQDDFFVAIFHPYLLSSVVVYQVLHSQRFTMLSWLLSDRILLYPMINQILLLICMVVMVVDEETVIVVDMDMVGIFMPLSTSQSYEAIYPNRYWQYDYHVCSTCSPLLSTNPMFLFFCWFQLRICSFWFLLVRLAINFCQLSCHDLIGASSLNCELYILLCLMYLILADAKAVYN